MSRTKTQEDLFYVVKYTVGEALEWSLIKRTRTHALSLFCPRSQALYFHTLIPFKVFPLSSEMLSDYQVFKRLSSFHHLPGLLCFASSLHQNCRGWVICMGLCSNRWSLLLSCVSLGKGNPLLQVMVTSQKRNVCFSGNLKKEVGFQKKREKKKSVYFPFGLTV